MYNELFIVTFVLCVSELVKMEAEFDDIGATVASTWEILSPELREPFEEEVAAALSEMANSQPVLPALDGCHSKLPLWLHSFLMVYFPKVFPSLVVSRPLYNRWTLKATSGYCRHLSRPRMGHPHLMFLNLSRGSVASCTASSQLGLFGGLGRQWNICGNNLYARILLVSSLQKLRTWKATPPRETDICQELPAQKVS